MERASGGSEAPVVAANVTARHVEYAEAQRDGRFADILALLAGEKGYICWGGGNAVLHVR